MKSRMAPVCGHVSGRSSAMRDASVAISRTVSVSTGKRTFCAAEGPAKKLDSSYPPAAPAARVEEDRSMT